MMEVGTRAVGAPRRVAELTLHPSRAHPHLQSHKAAGLAAWSARCIVKASLPGRAILQDSPGEERHAALPLPRMEERERPKCAPKSQEIKRV